MNGFVLHTGHPVVVGALLAAIERSPPLLAEWSHVRRAAARPTSAAPWILIVRRSRAHRHHRSIEWPAKPSAHAAALADRSARAAIASRPHGYNCGVQVIGRLGESMRAVEALGRV